MDNLKKNINEIPKDSIYKLSVKDSSGKEVSLEKFRSKLLLIVNVGIRDPEALSILKKLYTIKGFFGHRGLKILAFPCGQFGESETHQGVVDFLKTNNVDIGEIFAPVSVNGSNATSLFAHLKKICPGTLGPFIDKNFTMFLVDGMGLPKHRLMPPYNIDSMKDLVDTALKEKIDYKQLSEPLDFQSRFR